MRKLLSLFLSWLVVIPTGPALVLGLLLNAVPAHAAITGLTATATNAQILLTYTAPDSSACTIEASEEADYTPLVNDVDPALFDDADNDLARYPSVNTTVARTFVIGVHGKYVRTSDTMSVLSRALAAAKLHYIRVTCGMDVATTTATTVPYPFNSTYAPPIQLSDVDQSKMMNPTWPFTQNARLIDPWSGTELFRSGMPAENNEGSGFAFGSGGNVAVCSEKQHEDDWWFCREDAQGALVQMTSLFLHRLGADGNFETRYLGYAPSVSTLSGTGYCPSPAVGFDPTDFGVFYCQHTAGALNIVRYTYTGDLSNKYDDAPYNINPDVDTDIVATDIQDLFNTWADSHSSEWGISFDSAKFNCGFNGVVQADKNGGGSLLQVICREGQDELAWLAQFKVGVGIIGGFPIWLNSGTDACSEHSTEEIGQQGGLFVVTIKDIREVPPVTTLNGMITAMDTTLTLAGQTLRGGGKVEVADIQVGSALYFQDNGESVRVTGIGSFPTITVTRGINDSTPTDHANGVGVQRLCQVDGLPDTGQILWWPQDDPYGGAIANKLLASHEGIRPGVAIDGSTYAHYSGYLTGDVYDGAPNFFLSPTFSGYKTPGFCCIYETYPVPWFTQASDSLNQDMGIDARMMFYASNTYAAVMGTSQIYKVTLTRQVDIGFSNTLGWRYVPVIATGPYVAMDLESKMLRNISGPSSVLGDTSSDYQFCIVLIPDECIAGSMENEVYVSSPHITGSECDSGVYGTDVCVTERVQGTIGPNEYNTTPVHDDNQNMRTPLMPNTFLKFPADQTGTSYMKGLPDGSAVYMTGTDEDNHNWTILAKRQPTTSAAIDDLDRTVFLNQPCTYTGSVPMGATRMICLFGYSLDDTEAFQANPNRAENTIAVKATIDADFPTAPYLFESELTSMDGIDVTGDCLSTCTIAIPDTPVRRIGWMQVYFYTDEWTSGGSPTPFIGGGPVEQGDTQPNGGTIRSGKFSSSGKAIFN